MSPFLNGGTPHVCRMAVAFVVAALAGVLEAQTDSVSVAAPQAGAASSVPVVVDSAAAPVVVAQPAPGVAEKTVVSGLDSSGQQFVPPQPGIADSGAAVVASDSASAPIVIAPSVPVTGVVAADSARDSSSTSLTPLPVALSAAADSARAPAVSAAGPRIVAVMPLIPNGVDTASAQVLTDALSDELIRGGKVRVMERGQVDKILAEQGFQQSGACDGSECAVQMGRILGIDRMVVGSVGRIGAAYVLTVRGVDVGTGEVLASVRRQQVGALENVLTQLLPPLSSELGNRLSGMKTDTVSTAAPVAEVPQERVEERKPSRAWIWWTAGGVAVVGGTAAAILLLSDEESTSPTESKTSTSWKGEVTW